MNEKLKNQTVKNLFRNRYNIELTDIKRKTQKTPDFKFYKNESKIFVMELKTLFPVIPNESTRYGYKKDKFGCWCKKDNSPSKIAHKIKKAHNQLIQYNEPKILTFLNETNDLDFIDLWSAFTGEVPFKKQTQSWYKYVSQGEIREFKKDIDLYIWIDALNNIGKLDFKINFLPTNKKGLNIKKQYFT